MSDALPIVRDSKGRISHVQKRKLMLAIVSPKLPGPAKKIIQKWLTTRTPVVGSTSLYNALVAAQNIKAIW